MSNMIYYLSKSKSDTTINVEFEIGCIDFKYYLYFKKSAFFSFLNADH